MADLVSNLQSRKSIKINSKLGEFTVTDERHSSDLGTKKKGLHRYILILFFSSIRREHSKYGLLGRRGTIVVRR